jgi:hypothetical protein
MKKHVIPYLNGQTSWCTLLMYVFKCQLILYYWFYYCTVLVYVFFWYSYPFIAGMGISYGA